MRWFTLTLPRRSRRGGDSTVRNLAAFGGKMIPVDFASKSIDFSKIPICFSMFHAWNAMIPVDFFVFQVWNTMIHVYFFVIPIDFYAPQASLRCFTLHIRTLRVKNRFFSIENGKSVLGHGLMLQYFYRTLFLTFTAKTDKLFWNKWRVEKMKERVNNPFCDSISPLQYSAKESFLWVRKYGKGSCKDERQTGRLWKDTV